MSENYHALQHHLWRQIDQRLFDPTFPDSQQRWTHEDNENARVLGWAIFQLRQGASRLDLFSLTRAKPHEVMSTIAKMAPIDALCAKAVAVLMAQRMQHPDEKFQFMGPL